MDSFSSSPLMESFPSSRFPSPVPSPTHTECELPIEVDQSFNSSLSLGDTSPGFSPCPVMPKVSGVSPHPSRSTDFLSPSPVFGLKPRRPDPVPLQRTAPSPSKFSNIVKAETLKPLSARPLGQPRAFGREISANIMNRPAGSATTNGNKGKMLPPTLPEGKGAPRPRGGIPMQWTSSNEETGRQPRFGMQGSLFRREAEPPLSGSPCSVASTSVSDDFGMDIDSPAVKSRRSSVQQSPCFSGAASFSGSPGLGSFFCDSPGQPALAAAPPAKRRSLITDSPDSPSSGSPSAKRTFLGSGLNRPPIDKTASSSAMLFGGSRSSTVVTRRNPSYKRPTLGVLAPAASTEMAPRTAVTNSAYPILYGPPKPTLAQSGTFPRSAMAPMRRAFSVCDQNKMHEMEEEESEYEASPSMAGTQAEYMRRYGNRTNTRVDGSPGCKPVRASIATSGQGYASPVNKGKQKQKVSPYGPGGLPGFGDNEMDGKILPCHKVKEDGLVRITPNTLDDLLKGRYSDKVKRYHVIDCRFDYEYAGGHIAGAINVKSMDALDQLLLSESTGVHADGDSLPVPSRSGELGDGEQVVLVFHCEFSAKRAPTFAKHLRSRDRSLNNALYPKIFYPEVYILEGGYCGFYQTQPDRCEPRGYVPMDDPKHFERRNSDLHDFRKFSRTRSFTYGEQQTQTQPSRALPPCPQLAFAAASAATARRQGPTIKEEHDEHEHEHESSPSGSGSGADSSMAEDSPCTRAVSMGQPPIFGSAKTRVLGRAGFHRVASYAGTGMRQ